MAGDILVGVNDVKFEEGYTASLKAIRNAQWPLTLHVLRPVTAERLLTPHVAAPPPTPPMYNCTWSPLYNYTGFPVLLNVPQSTLNLELAPRDGRVFVVGFTTTVEHGPGVVERDGRVAKEDFLVGVNDTSFDGLDTRRPSRRCGVPNGP